MMSNNILTSWACSNQAGDIVTMPGLEAWQRWSGLKKSSEVRQDREDDPPANRGWRCKKASHIWIWKMNQKLVRTWRKIAYLSWSGQAIRQVPGRDDAVWIDDRWWGGNNWKWFLEQRRKCVCKSIFCWSVKAGRSRRHSFCVVRDFPRQFDCKCWIYE